jgi:hypothetical protein
MDGMIELDASAIGATLGRLIAANRGKVPVQVNVAWPLNDRREDKAVAAASLKNLGSLIDREEFVATVNITEDRAQIILTRDPDGLLGMMITPMVLTKELLRLLTAGVAAERPGLRGGDIKPDEIAEQFTVDATFTAEDASRSLDDISARLLKPIAAMIANRVGQGRVVRGLTLPAGAGGHLLEREAVQLRCIPFGAQVRFDVLVTND